MKLLVTGSAGHLGEALMRTLPLAGHEPFGLDVKESAFTHRVGSIVDRGLVRVCVRGMDVIAAPPASSREQSAKALPAHRAKQPWSLNGCRRAEHRRMRNRGDLSRTETTAFQSARFRP